MRLSSLFAKHNKGDQCLRNIKNLSKLLLIPFASCIQASYFFGLLICQFAISVLFSVRCATPALMRPISIVVSKRSQKQMARIYATRIIACMQHAQLLRERSIRNFVRKPMSLQTFVVNGYFSITMTECTRNPNPTRSKLWATNRNRTVLVNFGPKAREELWGILGFSHRNYLPLAQPSACYQQARGLLFSNILPQKQSKSKQGDCR